MIKRKPFIDVFLVYLLLFVSGTLLFNQSSENFLILAFFISVIAWALFSDRKIDVGFVLYGILFASFLLIIHFYTSGSLSLGTVIGSTMRLAVAYFLLKTVGKYFAATFINVMVFLAGFSLFGYITDQFHLFDNVIHKLPRVGDIGYEGIFYVYRYHYAGYDRNNSIFFEPGAYQGFLNATLFMLFFAKTEFSVIRRWIYIILLLITLFTTFSTTGFIIFSIMFVLFLSKSGVLSVSGKAVLTGFLLLMMVTFAAQFQDAILGKIDSYLSIQDLSDSRNRRSFDMLVDLEIIKRHLFGLGFKEYFKVFSATGLVSESGSSNGVTKLLAVYGLPFSLFYFGSFLWAFGRLLGGSGMLMSIVTFGMFLMFLVGESYYLFVPSTMAIIAAAFVYKRSLQDELVECETEVVR